MGTAFDTAQADIEAQRRAAVAAVAAGGSAGAQAFQQGQSQIDAARTAAVNAALSEAAQRGQGDIGGLLGGIVGTPYGQLSAGLKSSAASHAADFASQGAAADNYFRQLSSAVPMAASALEAKIAAAKAKANQLSDSELRTRLMGAGEIQRDQDLGDARHTHHLYQVRVEKAKAGLEQIHSALKGSKDPAQRRQLKEMRDSLTAELASARTARAPITESLKNADQHPIEEYARAAGLAAGEDENRVLGLVKMPTAKTTGYANQPSITEAAQAAGVGGKALARITKPSGADEASTHWEAVQSKAADYLKRGVPWQTFLADMKRGLRGHPRTIKLAAAYWAPIFQARG